jgi:hypothetical protein
MGVGGGTRAFKFTLFKGDLGEIRVGLESLKTRPRADAIDAAKKPK